MVHKIYVDSRKRIKGTTSNFTYQLPRPLEIGASRVFVDSVSIPNAFPSIHSKNKYIYIQEDVGSVTSKLKVPLTEGFYDAFSLAAGCELQHRLIVATIPVLS